MNSEKARFNMIEQQIRPWNVTNPRVLETLALVRRERFVPQTWRKLAFADFEIPIGQGQRMWAPRIEARVLQALALKGSESVLEIGTGTGYTAALLAAHAEWVRSLEIDPLLARLANENLERNGVFNVIVSEQDGSQGWQARAPYDVILAGGAVRSIPQPWLDQLKEGGRLFAFIGEAPLMRATLITRLADGSLQQKGLFETGMDSLCIAGDRKEFAL